MDNKNPIFFILEKIPIFKELSEDSYNLLLDKITLEYYPVHHQIFKEGDTGDALYIIKKGLVKIYKGSDDDPENQDVLANLSNDSFFGEMALVSESPRNASALTIEESEIFVLKKEDFDKLIAENPQLAEQIGSEYIQRLKKNEDNEQKKS